MREVLVFADAALDTRQRAWLLERLDALRQRPVICQVHLRPVRSSTGSPFASPTEVPHAAAPLEGRLPTQTARASAPGETREDQGTTEERDVELVRARRRLCELVELVRADGHVAHGELLAGPLIRALTRGIAKRSPDQVLLLTSDQRLEVLLRRDLERRLRHAATVPVRVLDVSSGLPRT